MIYSPSGTYAGIGFAVPVDTVNRVVPRLIAYGRYVRPTIGISANDQISRRLLGDRELTGVLVLDVAPDSPAARAGLKATEMTASGRVVLGDVIQDVDGKPVQTFDDLVDELDEHGFGDTVTLAVLRGRERLEIDVKLSAAAPLRSR